MGRRDTTAKVYSDKPCDPKESKTTISSGNKETHQLLHPSESIKMMKKLLSFLGHKDSTVVPKKAEVVTPRSKS